MPPKRRKTKRDSEEFGDPEAELRTAYAIHFMQGKLTDATPIHALLGKALKSLGISFPAEIRGTEETLKDYPMEEFIRDVWRVQHFEARQELFEFIFDVCAENGLLSREDERGYETSDRPPIEELFVTMESLTRAIKRLNQRIPKESQAWMMQLLVDTEGKELRPAQPFRRTARWTDFKRMLFANKLLDDKIPDTTRE